MRELLHLALDTSTSRPAVALMRNREVLSDWLGPDALRHHETLLRGVDHCLKEAGHELANLDFLSCGVGPGMFTGLRIGVTTAKFLADPLELPCVAVSSLMALALQSGKLGIEPVWAVSDARSQRVYALRLAPGDVATDYAPHAHEEVATPPAEAALRMRAGEYVLGEGASLYRDVWPPGIVRPADSEQNWLRASAVGALGFIRYGLGLTCTPTELEPTYLKTGQPHL